MDGILILVMFEILYGVSNWETIMSTSMEPIVTMKYGTGRWLQKVAKAELVEYVRLWKTPATRHDCAALSEIKQT